jgi:hypothetical protein
LLCPLIKDLFSPTAKCESPESSFVAQPILSGRFSMSSSSSFYHMLPDLGHLVEYFAYDVCPKLSESLSCRQLSSELMSADYVDIDYDTISHAIVLRAFTTQPPLVMGWSERTKKYSGMGSVEVGVLSIETQDPDEPESIKLGGFLTVVGQDAEPSKDVTHLAYFALI